MSVAAIEWGQLAGVIMFAITVGGVMWAIWFRIEGKVERAGRDAAIKADAAAAMAQATRDELAAHKLHIAETYVTKAGLQEQTSQIMRAIEGVGTRIEALNGRLDRAFEHGGPPH